MKYFISLIALILVAGSCFLVLNPETDEPNLPLESATEPAVPEVALPPEIVPEVEPEEEPVQEEELEVEPEKEYIVYVDEEGYFELPLEGATGFASTTLYVRGAATSNSELLFTISSGTGFTILEEEGQWWLVDINGDRGYVYHPYCFLNLPDVVPSMVYDNTNASQSIITSSYLPIPNITGEKLYDAYSYNERLGRDEYITPVLYGTAKKIALAQKMARDEGNTLIIYECYRPYVVQEKIKNELAAVSRTNPVIYAGISASPWSTDWFVATGISNHQQGYAVDLSYGKINEIETFTVGDYLCETITDYEEAEMPTPLHEVSTVSKSLAYPVNSNSATAWKSVPVASSMNEAALKLREYCTNAGLTPLASEWWHFNDLDFLSSSGKGDFLLTEVYSVVPSSIS